MISKRIIARLDVKGNKLIKGVSFEGVRVVGEPNTAAKKYENEGADELLYIDAVASLYGRNSISNVLKIASKKIFIPITASGGIRSVNDAEKLISSGADKIALNTAALNNPNLIRELVENFGSQCVVISIQARKKYGQNSWEAMSEMGREKSGKNVLSWIKEVQELGVGEILLTSVDKDGTLSKPDFELIKAASKITKIPLIVSGGLTSTSDIKHVFHNDAVSGVALGGCLHYEKQSINLLKKQLANKKINVRKKNNEIFDFECNKALKDIKIGIIDYGMGNHQSLLNSLEFLGANVFISSEVKKLKEARLLALPGVGAFPNGMKNLEKLDLKNFIKEKVTEGLPLLGICLGMQMLFERSTEFKITEGLNLINGEVDLIGNNKIKLPHMGWNKLTKKGKNTLYPSEIYQYFVHSYAVQNADSKDVIYECNYENINFVVGIKKDNIVGLQFHPERSGVSGINLLSKIIINLLAKK